MDIIWIDECGSTNTMLAQMGAKHATALCSRKQTAGRGQRGNSWESEPLKNLTFSLLLKPNWVLASRQFEVSMAVSIAIVEVLDSYLGTDASISIKWPNDIYVGDKKICGILIENVLVGNQLAQCIVGVGLNVNQTRFTSPAPNPLSMAMVSGREFALEPIAAEITKRIVKEVEALAHEEHRHEIMAKYFARLWRRDGYFSYFDVKKREQIKAKIEFVAPTGLLTLRLQDNSLRTYAFKEVQAVIQF